jgi:hypothetical protein
MKKFTKILITGLVVVIICQQLFIYIFVPKIRERERKIGRKNTAKEIGDKIASEVIKKGELRLKINGKDIILKKQ